MADNNTGGFEKMDPKKQEQIAAQGGREQGANYGNDSNVPVDDA
jgi:general stress protein YciG